MAVKCCSRFVVALSLQSKDMTSTIIYRMAVSNGRLAPPFTDLRNRCNLYLLTVRKYDQSVVRRIILVIWDPTIDVITSVMASFTLIIASLAVFFLSASSFASAFDQTHKCV